MSKKMLIVVGLLVVGVLVTGLMVTRTGATAVAKLNQQGNDAFYQDAYDEAWGMYQSAQIENPELAEPHYNAANALYKQGLYEEALTQMGVALQFATDESLAEQLFFNLGNASFNMEDMETAVSSYIEALLRNPNDADAKYNLELALVQQQQQEQEQQEQQEQEEQEQEEQEQEESEQEQEQSGEGEESEDQSDGGDEGEQEGEESEGEGEEPSEPEEGEGEEESDSQAGEEGEEEGDPQDGTGQRSEPTGEEGNDGFTPAPGERMTQEQAEQLLAALAGNSQTLQEALGQMLMIPNGRPPVQDW